MNIRSRCYKLHACRAVMVTLLFFFTMGRLQSADLSALPNQISSSLNVSSSEVKPVLASSRSKKITASARAEEEQEKLNEAWGKKISKGGYILYFRHAHRVKWDNVRAYDVVEISGLKSRLEQSIGDATCLSNIGVEDAKLIGELFKINKINIETVISSPSCRAMQTAQYAFGRFDKIENALLHKSVINRVHRESFAHRIKQLFVENTPSAGRNTIFVGHNGTLDKDREIIFDIDETAGLDTIQQGGFIVIENSRGKLIARHIFRDIDSYATATLGVSFP
jgi:phosphohistidine phosphatase SixA